MRKVQINTLPGYENYKSYYWIQDDGQVWSDYKQGYLNQYKGYNSFTLRDKWLNGEFDKEPYFIMRVGLHRNNSTQPAAVPVHRIVATAFVPNPNNLPEVNHIDKNTTNNNYTNLEWIEKDKNIKIGLSKAIWKCDKQTHERIENFNSISDAARAIEVPEGTKNIIAVCKGRRKSAYGFFWEYDE